MNWMFNSEGRRAAAFLALLGGAIVMTVYACVVLWLIRRSPGYTFWLGLAAHGQIAIITTGFVALFVKRSVKFTRDGVEVSDDVDKGASNTP